ncbi:D-alanyl-D-alanine carboxypeptidase/D-alanyl-D-alanine endopeptidase [Salegentibacter flavus]|uniref:D-alanyl-D-alanine carboxypeptidase / D-alanyl-D-alanine-endopeptidase (Penicillin-binding protein 4) n=1 Tax=Salegentibacter flavus TaxID=287099 RepID=A0A1I4XTJ6_9FLAO|nr:D-alanyl-D-alanine carboxypeptidase/D-alanyl-D-alanine-endopeptidase [Salegentibacter flavus]SFN29152.1 D-alanyl-D-alanine carboxypeptidase / D-alanyl-D-alanine-endopeptidase (penicillin-binding protein 4) [Salegentibacter flavus]
MNIHPLIIFGLIIFLGSCSVSKRTTKNIDNSFREAPAFKQGFAGFMVYDPEEKKILYNHNGRKYFTPASNTKLFSLYTGLKILGDSVPALKYTIKNDSLFFTGTGDPSLLNPNLPDSQVIPFLNERNETLVMVPPVYTEKHQGPGWAWDDFNSYYSAERTPFPIYGNLVEFTFKSSEEKPEISPTIFSDSIVISETKRSRVRREIRSNTFLIQNSKREINFSQNVPFHYSTEMAAALLSDTLKKPVFIKKSSEMKFTEKLYSIPVDSMYKRMMETSDNFIAEQILLMAAQQISDTLKSDIAIKHMKETFLKNLTDEPYWVDGSGLSRYNLFTPRTMISLLLKIKEEVPEDRLLSLLATGGQSGTLRNFYKAEEPYIFAKTGTLRHNHSLSGYLLTKKGKLLVFSFMNSNYTVPTSELKDAMEQILLQIRDNY